jgi:hypothetical protein
MSEPRNDDAWLARPATIRLLWRVLWGVLALTVLAQLVIPGVPGDGAGRQGSRLFTEAR